MVTPYEISTSHCDIQQIEQLAYAHFIKEGRPSGRDVQHWLDAESELRDESLARNAALVKYADEGIKRIMIGEHASSEHSLTDHPMKKGK